MRLSKIGYYADFIAYPAITLALIAIEFWPPESMHQVHWLLACILGVAEWTLAEYLIHRFVFHQLPVIARMHDMHHESPGALIGAPLWLSMSAFGSGVFIPLWWSAGFDIASGMTTGLVFGYLWYVTVHTVIHRWRLDQSSLLYQIKLRHLRHHYSTGEGNFGVTTCLWDLLLGTAIEN
jgi:sterol desaturase/sphingolipid hydroxylase (fatty acid hydroxylase superfamily)